MTEHTILIPDKVKYTKGLFCQVDPPHDNMDMSFTIEGEKEPFRVGKLISRRCPEIAVFMFRPAKLNTTTKQRNKPLKAGDKIKVKITLYKKGDPNKRTLSEPFETKEAIVEVT